MNKFSTFKLVLYVFMGFILGITVGIAAPALAGTWDEDTAYLGRIAKSSEGAASS